MPLSGAALLHAAAAGGAGPLLSTQWAQRGPFAALAPVAAAPNGSAPPAPPQHERLGCWSAALAQVMARHRACPAGQVNYTAPGYPTTAWDFDAESATGLCDWAQFADRPQDEPASAAMHTVARYSYAMSLIFEKKWGTGSYMLDHLSRAAAVTEHFAGWQGSVRNHGGGGNRTAQKQAIVGALRRGEPTLLHIADTTRTHEHDVVIDGYNATAGGAFLVHLNVGHGGLDNGWYDFEGAICLHFFPNGTNCGGGCCALYNDTSYRELLFITRTGPF